MTWRILILLHRYLGIAIGALILMWFASGIVMLYVPYPALHGPERAGILEPILWSSCCRDPGTALAADQPVERAELETVAGVLALRITLPGPSETLASLDIGAPDVPMDPAHARRTAIAAARRLAITPVEAAPVQSIARDQWTVSGEYNADRPLLRFDFSDRASTQIYVSSQRGRVVLRTTSHQRFWNWLGAVPHWLYPTVLRSQPRVWLQVVIWTSLLGVFLTLIGLYLGVVQFSRRGRRLLSPYQGLWNWHHSLGLLFGVITLTWVGSGLVSMNPWGLLEGGPGIEPAPESRAVTWGEIRSSLAAIAESPTVPDVVNLALAPLSGELFWIATRANGVRVRMDALGLVHTMTPLELTSAAQHAAGPQGIASMSVLQHEDAYYYGRHEPAVLPVLRVIVNDPQGTRLYLDPLSGRLLGQIDRDGRWQRWLFDGLHRLDFSAGLRASAGWRAFVLILLSGGIGLSATGTYLAVRRVIHDAARLRRPRHADH